MKKDPIENILVIDLENHPKIGIVKEPKKMNTKGVDQERDISIITVINLTGEGMRNCTTRRLTHVVRVHNIDPGVSRKDVMIQKRMYLTMKEVDTLVDVKMTDVVPVTESMLQVSIGTQDMNDQSGLRGHHLIVIRISWVTLLLLRIRFHLRKIVKMQDQAMVAQCMNSIL